MCSNTLRNFCRFTNFLKPNTSYNVLVSRGARKRGWPLQYFSSLYKRRIDQGPEPERPRSAWLNWNYEAEIYSFGKRLGEEFQNETLKTAFTNRSYVELEKQKRAKLGIQNELTELQLNDNVELREKGEAFAKDYVETYLRHCYPLLPEEGINAVTSHLMSVETLSLISLNLGIKDLALTEEFPVSNETLSNTLKAVIGGLYHDQGPRRTELFVQDFILTQLVGKTIPDIWVIRNPMGLLTEILEKQQRGTPEPRLLWSSASETIMAMYMVGIYCNKELIGQSPGETVTIAEEMAARDALSHIFQTMPGATPLPFGKKGHELQLKGNFKELPISLKLQQ